MTKHWTTDEIFGIPADGAEHTIPLRVRSTDHPGAIVTARTAHRAVLTYQHIDELSDLTADQLYYLTNDVAKLAASAGAILDTLIYQLREAGASWETLGAALDVHRSTAKGRYERIVAGRAKGITSEAVRNAESQSETAQQSKPWKLTNIQTVIVDHLDRMSACPECSHISPQGMPGCDCTRNDCACRAN